MLTLSTLLTTKSDTGEIGLATNIAIIEIHNTADIFFAGTTYDKKYPTSVIKVRIIIPTSDPPKLSSPKILAMVQDIIVNNSDTTRAGISDLNFCIYLSFLKIDSFLYKNSVRGSPKKAPSGRAITLDIKFERPAKAVICASSSG